MTDMPRFSVVLPTRDRPDRLRSAVESIMVQSFQDFDVWIVDDGSGSATVAACREWATTQRIYVLRNESTTGAAAARNRGARSASGEYLAFIDDDCVWHPDRLRQVDCALRESEPSPGYVCTQTVVIHSGPPVAYEREPATSGARAVWQVGTHMMTVARRVFLEVGGFDERLPRIHDWDLAVRVVEATSWRLILEPLAWTDRPEGLSDDPAKMERASQILADKHGPRSPVSRTRAADFHTAFAHKLLAADHWREGVRHYALAVRLTPARLRGWLYLAAALPGPAAQRAAVHLARLVLGEPQAVAHPSERD